MTIFKPVFENTTENLADVNAHFDNRREEKLTLDTSLFLLIDGFKTRIKVIGDTYLPCNLLDVKRIQARVNQKCWNDTQKKPLN